MVDLQSALHDLTTMEEASRDSPVVRYLSDARLMVSKRGCASGRSALYKASRVSPDAMAISLMPRAPAMSLKAAANNAGSFASRMSQTRGDCRIAVESRCRVELKAGI